jgi:hypothetical protein
VLRAFNASLPLVSVNEVITYKFRIGVNHTPALMTIMKACEQLGHSYIQILTHEKPGYEITMNKGP